MRFHAHRRKGVTEIVDLEWDYNMRKYVHITFPSHSALLTGDVSQLEQAGQRRHDLPTR